MARFIHQVSEPGVLDELARNKVVTAYIGFDCTAPSLHVGSLVQIMLLYWLQKTGHQPIALMGGGTTRVGDPSGRDETRRILTYEQIEANKDSIKGVFSKFLTFGPGKSDALMPDNAEWLATLNYVEFLRDVGRHFSINRMLTMDSVKMRLDRQQEMSFLEFNYYPRPTTSSAASATAACCRWHLGPMGQHRQRHRPRPAHARRAIVRALAADLDRVGRQDGQTRPAPCGSTPTWSAPMSTGVRRRNTEDGGVAVRKLFTTLPLSEIGRLAALQGQKINEAKKVQRKQRRDAARPRGGRIDGRRPAHDNRRCGREPADHRSTARDLRQVSAS